MGCSDKESACNAEAEGAAGDAGSILGGEDPLQEGITTQSSFLPRGSHGQRSLAGYIP